jgi:hypothetical protein
MGRKAIPANPHFRAVANLNLAKSASIRSYDEGIGRGFSRFAVQAQLKSFRQ